MTNKKTFFQKLCNLFNSESQKEKQLNEILDDPKMLQNIYLKVLEMQNQNREIFYIG